MREITSHRINPVNDKIKIFVTDEPGAGGANHTYSFEFEDPTCNETVHFQNGPIAESGVNGITQEVLLAVIIDRLQSFQKGPYACRENALALTKLEEAKLWLFSRTMERMTRGVEGTHEK